MQWKNSFAIGIDTIDAQHKKIFERLLAIENSIAKRDPWHVLRFLVEQLAEYMKFHLAVEEAILEIIKYPGRKEHLEAHAGIIEQMAELERGLKENTTADSLVRFFENWFLRHVLDADRDYVAYIREEMPALLGRQPV